MRPPALKWLGLQQDFLKAYENAVKIYKAEKLCNQFYIAEKIQQDFAKCDGLANTLPQIKELEIKRLAQKYQIPEHSITNLASYVCRVTPAAIVQMNKRLRKQVQNASNSE